MKALNHPNTVKLFEVLATKKALFTIVAHKQRGHVPFSTGLWPHDREGGRRHFLVAAHHWAVLPRKGHHPQGPGARECGFDAELNVKLTDFVLSNKAVSHKLSTFCGSLPHAAPDLSWPRGRSVDPGSGSI